MPLTLSCDRRRFLLLVTMSTELAWGSMIDEATDTRDTGKGVLHAF
jgi:hypothetical protein